MGGVWIGSSNPLVVKIIVLFVESFAVRSVLKPLFSFDFLLWVYPPYELLSV